MTRWVGAVIAALWVATAPAYAEKLAVGDVHAEPDVADEATAVGLLVRSALPGNDRTIVDAPADITLSGAPAQLSKLGADHVLLLELSRDGTGLRVTFAVVGTDGAPDIAYVRAGDGDIHALAKGVADHVTTALRIEAAHLSDAAFGRLHPYVSAIRAETPAAAEAALADAIPQSVLGVPAAREALHAVPGALSDPKQALLAARAIGDAKKLDELGKGGDATALAARVFAAIQRTNVAAAEAALGAKPPKDGLVALARVRVAELRSDDGQLRDRVREALASDQQRPLLALAAAIAPARLTKELHEALAAAVTAHIKESPGVAAELGLAAAEAGDPHALEMISVRELDDYEVARLEPLIAKGADATSLRLRAELAMRRADGSIAAAIAAYLRAAPGDPRAHRYHGWQLMASGRPGEAAAEFGKAAAPLEQARALAAAGDTKGALAVLGRAPKSPEELAIAARAALIDGQLESARQTIDLAEHAAPVDPIVHATVVALTAQAPDATRQATSTQVLDHGIDKETRVLVAMAANTPTPSIQVTSAGSDTTQSPIVRADIAVTVDTALLEPMLQELPALAQIHKLAIAELRWSAGVLSFRATHPELVRAGLVQLLAGPAYHLQLEIDPREYEGSEIAAKQLAALTENADAVLVYRVEPATGHSADVSLVLYQRGAAEATQIARTLDLPGLVGMNTTKVFVVGGFAAILLLAGLLWLTRGMGRIELQIELANDATDTVLCAEISKTKTRPVLPEELSEFRDKTKAAGSIHKRTQATLIASGVTFKVPTGHWYVHLYGCFARGGRLRAVPDNCTREVDLRRGHHDQIVFDLTSKLAELTIAIESEPRRGVEIWANDDEHGKVLTNAKGEAVVMLPIGTHVLHIVQGASRLDHTEQILSSKVQRIAINVARELRLAGGIALELDDEPAPEPAKPEVAKTQAVAPGSLPSMPPAEPAQSPAPGTTLLGRYRVTSELGRGAMGVVHRAWDDKLEREVAIKEMAEDLRKYPEALKLFTQEAKALAQLNHTNIVAMYDQITDERSVYMIMEFVDGVPLEKIIEERGALPWLEAVGIVDQVCAGLAYAHARKVIHRDIKPANVFVANDRTVKLGDFGLARVMREVTIRRTEIRGTPLYMAPEQITGTDVDHRTDLYAVGCTLFELVTGRPPFIDGDILYAQMNLPPPAPSSLDPKLPKALDELVLRLLAKHAEDRPASANEVRSAFKQLFDS